MAAKVEINHKKLLAIGSEWVLKKIHAEFVSLRLSLSTLNTQTQQEIQKILKEREHDFGRTIKLPITEVIDLSSSIVIHETQMPMFEVIRVGECEH